MSEFANEPLLELRREQVRTQAIEALARLDAALPLEVPILVGGEPHSGRPFESVDPCAPDRVVAVAQASDEKVGHAIDRATEGAREWASTPAEVRASTLMRAAGLLRSRRFELAALAVREAGKPWPEADGDVCEAIDFLEYYARGALALDSPAPLVQTTGERNSLSYVPRGVVGVIAPWNFPIAILTGMTAAALATGNAVVVKPAEQTPACAAAVVDALHAAGVPANALALVPGADEPGRELVAHPAVHAIAFTGSCAAGLEIIERCAIVHPNQSHVKRVVAEMGGKNAVLVDADADLDEAVPAIARSAFAFAGQKCSAASRVLAHETIAETLRERLAGAVETLTVGPAEELATDVPALIDEASQQRVRRYLELGDEEGTCVARAKLEHDSGYYVPPAVFDDLPPHSALIEEEIFGPVLALQSVPDVETACDLVEESRFALTAGLFSRSPATIERVSRRLPVGNLYVNRAITGAVVGQQPFGGGKLSGIGFKAGGPDYLLQVCEARVVPENTMRHGVAT